MFQFSLREPTVFHSGVPFPRYQILVFASSLAVVFDSIYFIFFFSCDKVRRGFREIRTVNLCLLIGR
jgi:hypothetical protein